jgi:hypothetical protein
VTAILVLILAHTVIYKLIVELLGVNSHGDEIEDKLTQIFSQPMN